jgi:hypothetical protein
MRFGFNENESVRAGLIALLGVFGGLDWIDILSRLVCSHQ